MRTHILTTILVIFLITYNMSGVKATITLGTNAGFVNTTGAAAPPGSMPIQIDISQMGTATGSLNFELPNGFGGITPQLGLNYNNYTELGNFGIGCNLSGISMITRSGQNIYHDNNVSEVTFTNSDRFSIDGQRLIIKTGTYGANGTIYITENDNFSIIKSIGNQNNAPDYFSITTKDGTVLTYGSSDAKITVVNSGLSTITLAWPIKRITDIRGNYIEFNYNNSTDGQLKLNSIKYTGNSSGNISPQYSITFNYQEFSDPVLSFLGGRQLKNSLYITSVIVNDLNSNAQLNKYEFLYSGKYLNKINKYYKGKLTCLPTVFDWNKPSLNATPKLYSEWGSADLYDGLSDFQSIYGDVDHDGNSDIVKISRTKDRKWAYYSNNGGILTEKGSGLLPQKCLQKRNAVMIVDYEWYWNFKKFKYDYTPITEPYVAEGFILPYTFFDIDRDGTLELCLIEANKEIDPDNYNFRVYNITSAGLILEPGFNKDNIGAIGRDNYFFMGNFSGSGEIDLVPFRTNSQSMNTQNIIDFSPITNFKTLSIFELNGDPKTEILAANENSIKIYKSIYSSSSSKNILTLASTLSNLNIDPSTLLIDDYNGDGLTDLLLYDISSSTWRLY